MRITRAPLRMPGPAVRFERCRSRRLAREPLLGSDPPPAVVLHVAEHHAVDGHDLNRRALGEQARPFQRGGVGQSLGGSFLAYPPFLAVDDAFGVLDDFVIGGFGRCLWLLFCLAGDKRLEQRRCG